MVRLFLASDFILKSLGLNTFNFSLFSILLAHNTLLRRSSQRSNPTVSRPIQKSLETFRVPIENTRLIIQKGGNRFGGQALGGLRRGDLALARSLPAATRVRRAIISAVPESTDPVVARNSTVD